MMCVNTHFVNKGKILVLIVYVGVDVFVFFHLLNLYFILFYSFLWVQFLSAFVF